MKRCPRCAEDCRTEAAICRYCQHEFTPEETAAGRRQDMAGTLLKAGLIIFVLVFIISEIGGVEGLGSFVAGVEQRAAEQADLRQ